MKPRRAVAPLRFLFVAHVLLGSCVIAGAFVVKGSVDGATLLPPSSNAATHGSRTATVRWARRWGGATTLLEEDTADPTERRFDPLNEASDEAWDSIHERSAGPSSFVRSTEQRRRGVDPSGLAALAALPLLTLPDDVSALALPSKSMLNAGDFNPETFRPVCPASDSFYRFLQGTTEAVVGDDAFVEYGPLIAGGLLRIRLELCVVESFFNEAVGPFIEKEGYSWILPLHETVETFLAGTIFALASTFILVGSTKIVAVISVYGDAFIGAPCRLFGGFLFDRALGKPVTLDIGLGPWKTRLIGPPEDLESGGGKETGDVTPGKLPVVLASGAMKYLGEGSKIIRDTIEALDLFIGRYLVLIATGYIGLKFIHFKVFPDFPPF